MLERGKMERGVFEIIDTESLMPQEHLLRGIDAAVDFDKIYDMVEPMYCQDNGRPGVDPVVLFQLVTLPVEFNASRRALKTLESSYILDSDEVRQSGKVLTAAALTYVAALATALLNLMRLIAIRGRRD